MHKKFEIKKKATTKHRSINNNNKNRAFLNSLHKIEKKIKINYSK